MNLDTSKALVAILGESRWVAVRLAHTQLALAAGKEHDAVSRSLYESSSLTLKRSRAVCTELMTQDIESLFEPRKNVGSAANPITKMFPAAVTERQFLDRLDDLCEARASVTYRDERFTGHTLVDFTVIEGDLELPVNVKNAGTRFENAQSLVGLDPNDCVPIPAYKAHDAVEKEPNLLYAICVDYSLIETIERELISRLNEQESIVWRLLSEYSGSLIRDAEDRFVYSIVDRHWDVFSRHVQPPVFHVISARKSIRILQQQPKRTPGIGLRAWGTGASAEVNVHISVAAETKPWQEIEERIVTSGVNNIVSAVNRKRVEEVYDPEI